MLQPMDTQEIRRLVAVEDRHWWFREKRARLRAAVADLPTTSAVEVGAAGGGNAAALADMGWDVCIVEPDAEGGRVARERGLPSIRGRIETLPLRSESVGLAVALDVLEHIPDDETAAFELFRVLRPGARLVVNVPADMALWSGHDEALGHVRRYQRDELVKLLRGAGFAVQSCVSWNVLLRPVVRIRRRRATGSEMQEHNPFVNSALRAVLAAEHALPLSRFRGVSLFAVAHRPPAGRDV